MIWVANTADRQTCRSRKTNQALSKESSATKKGKSSQPIRIVPKAALRHPWKVGNERRISTGTWPRTRPMPTGTPRSGGPAQEHPE